jgi:hypothetical protein
VTKAKDEESPQRAAHKLVIITAEYSLTSINDTKGCIEGVEV